MRGLRLLPAAEGSIDGDQLHLGKLLGILGRDRFEPRPIEMAGGNLLALRGIQEFEIGLRDLLRAVLRDKLVYHRDRRLGQNAERGRYDLDLVGTELLHTEERFVLPGDQHIADAALDEGRGRSARAGVEDRYVLVQTRDELLGFCVVVAEFLERI